MSVQRSLAGLVVVLLAAGCRSAAPVPELRSPAEIDGQTMIQPPRLEPGATIMFVAPAGDLDEERMLRARDRLQAMGYESKILLDAVRHSHERFDGSGYPDGLAGEFIPMASRIIAVADAYDALCSWRPYREKWDRTVAIDELKRSSTAGQFDPAVVDALVAILDS